ncbi:MAG: sugar phosphate nucleotidyltransferase [Acidobacteriota bacterium]
MNQQEPLLCGCMVLAGGEGQRMSTLIRSWLGRERPKQYCTFVGTRSMLKHTLDRVSSFVNGQQIVTVIGKNHLIRFWQNLGESLPGRILEQPVSLGTGTGIFLAATCILANDPNATFLILPSDHFVYPEHRFVAELKEMARLAELFSNRLIVLGVKPDRPETEYGWIQPGGERGERIRDVKKFREKPVSREAVDLLFEPGSLWNTLVIATKGHVLWRLGERFFPRMLEKFGALRATLESAYRGQILDTRTGTNRIPLPPLTDVYEGLEVADFSSDLLQRAPEQTLVYQMGDGLRWSDWGKPERVWESLQLIGKTPRFPRTLAFQNAVGNSLSPSQ